jgi:hypothetical protein
VLVVFGVAAWLMRGGRPSPGAAPIAAAALTWWVLLAADFLPNWREPETSRYQLISVTFVILLAAEAFRGIRLSRQALAYASALALVIVGSNLAPLKEGYDFFRSESTIARADLGALDVGERHIAPKFRLLQPIAGSIYLTGVFAGPYYRERDAHGSPAYTPAEIAAAPPAARSAADVVLANGYGMRLEPAAPPPEATGCRRLAPRLEGGGGEIKVPAGTVGLSNLGPAPARLRLRRFADDSPVDLGDLPPGRSARLRIPRDPAPVPWKLKVTGAATLVCPQ